MLEYKLKGKHIILQIDPEFLPHLAYAGIEGSPLFAQVFKVEEDGFWLETREFRACPTPIIKLYGPKGQSFCRAHIFIPRSAILSIVAFPSDVPPLEKDPTMYRIGFRPKGARRKRRRASS